MTKYVTKNATKLKKVLPAQDKHSRGKSFFNSIYPYLIITFLGSVVYFQILSFEIVECDDFEIIQKYYSRIEKISNFGHELFSGYIKTNNYRPLMNISFLMDAQIGKQSPIIYHLSNMIYHILFSLLLYYLLILLLKNKSSALILSLIFVVHPLFTNAISWIVGRNDTIYSLFGILSLIGLIRYYETKKLKFLLMNVIGFLLAILTKETALLLPLLFISYIYIIKNERKLYKDKSFGIMLLGWIASIIVYFIMRGIATLGDQVYHTGFDVLLMNLRLIPEICTKFFLPVSLSVLPTYNIFNTVAGISLIIIFIFLFFYLKNKNRRLAIFGILFFLVLSFPAMLFTFLGSGDWNDYLECRAYFPAVGILIFLASIIPERLLNFKTISSRTAIISIIAILSTLNIIQSRNYSNPIQFYESAVRDDPSKPKFHRVLAFVYSQFNNDNLAEREFLENIRWQPNYSKNYQFLGAFYSDKERYDDAINIYKIGIESCKPNYVLYDSLTVIYSKIGKEQEAINILESALKQSEEDSSLLYNLSYCWLKSGNLDSSFFYADILIQKKASLFKLYALFNNFSLKLIKEKKYEIIVLLLKKAIEIEPDKLEPYHNLYQFYLYEVKDINLARFYAEEVKKHGGILEPQDVKKMEEKSK